MRKWSLAEARARFNEVVGQALAHEPQMITRYGRDAVVIVSEEDFRRLYGELDLVTFLRESPLAEAFASGDFHLDCDP